MPISMRMQIVRQTGHSEASDGGQTVMMSIERGRYYAVSGAGQRIWELAEEPITVEEIVEILYDEFDVDFELLIQDVTAFVEGMMKCGLLAEQPG